MVVAEMEGWGGGRPTTIRRLRREAVPPGREPTPRRVVREHPRVGEEKCGAKGGTRHRRRLRERFRPHPKEEAMKSTQTGVLRVHVAAISAESRDLAGRPG